LDFGFSAYSPQENPRARRIENNGGGGKEGKKPIKSPNICADIVIKTYKQLRFSYYKAIYVQAEIANCQMITD